MALLDLESEMARASDGAPFANSTEGLGWMSLWCVDCVNDIGDDCPLVGVALLGRTPKQWDDASPGELNRYVCNEFVKKKEQQ